MVAATNTMQSPFLQPNSRAVPWVLLAALSCASLAACDPFGLVGTLTDDAGPSPNGADGAADAALEASIPDTDGGPRGGSCDREVAVCNPVRNTGCPVELATQCGPDLSAATLAGYCTFTGPIPDAGIGCLNTVATESCPATTACVNGQCRPLCFCDADCGPGTCCTEPLGEQGFFLCAPC
jgi:hypothetical protein